MSDPLSVEARSNQFGAAEGDGIVRCDACPILCRIRPGRAGACARYANENGHLVRTDPVATVIDGCVGCGLCGENAHAAVLCPSFYRAEVIQNPTWWDRLWNGNSLKK